jgi:tetratricopeptide (TPR) repeat protein
MESLRDALIKAFQDLPRQDALAVLGVEEDASPSAIQKRFVEFAHKFGPWNFQSPELQPLAMKAEELLCAGARAYAEVSDFEKFKALVARRRTVRTAAIKPNLSERLAIKTDLLDTAAQFRNARNLMGQQKFKEAVTVLEFVCDCEPENPVYRAELAWCSFLNNPVVGSQPLKELAEVLRMDPACGIAAFYAGEIARRTGRFDDADRLLRQAERLLPRDPRPNESLRLLPKRR